MSTSDPMAIHWNKFRTTEITPYIFAFVSAALNQFFLSYLGFSPFVQYGFLIFYIGVFFGGNHFLGFTFIYRGMWPITIGLLFVMLYVYFYSGSGVSIYFEAHEGNDKFLRLLFDILSVLYAICTAFLLWKGLNDHDLLRQRLSGEANTIERIVGYSQYFDLEADTYKKFANQLLSNLLEYIQNITGEYDQINKSEKNAVLLRETVSLLSEIKIHRENNDANDKIAYEQMMLAVSDLATARSQRISQMEVKMSPYFVIALGAMSLAVIYPFFTQAPADDNVRQICVFVLASLLSFLLIALWDISRPFSGFWKIRTESFNDIRALIYHQLGKVAEKETNHSRWEILKWRFRQGFRISTE